MLTFTVHEPPDPPADRIDRAERLAFVRDGFSWTAALFTPIWLLVHRLWWPLVAYLLAQVLLAYVGQSALVDPGWLALASLALSLLIGFEASTLRRWALARRGWTTIGAVSGRNIEDCERRWFEMWLPTQPIISAAKPAAGGGSGGGSHVGALSASRG